METNSEFEIDPAIAAAMGFGGFGSQTKGKRKLGAADFVDPDIGKSNASHATGANSLPTREHKATKTAVDDTAGSTSDTQATEDPRRHQQAASGGYDLKVHDSPSLELLRYGVKNTNGDMVYFLSSFLEDPWARLKSQ